MLVTSIISLRTCPYMLRLSIGHDLSLGQLLCEGSPNREGPKLGQVGGGPSAGVPLGRGATAEYAGWDYGICSG